MYYLTSNKDLRFLASMHIVPAEASQLPNWVQEAYEWAECLVFESEVGASTLSRFMAEDGTGLDKKLSASVYSGLSELWLANPGLPDLDRLRPWAAALLSGAALSPMAPGVEPCFIQWAIEDEKEVEYLELPSFFPGLADAIPTQLIDETLAGMLANINVTKASQLDMHRSWVDRDMQKFNQIAQSSTLLKVPQFRRALLDQRNAAWASKLRLLMSSTKRTLVAVGALHLCVAPSAQHFAGIDLEMVQ